MYARYAGVLGYRVTWGGGEEDQIAQAGELAPDELKTGVVQPPVAAQAGADARRRSRQDRPQQQVRGPGR